jgi:hypothetical protein
MFRNSRTIAALIRHLTLGTAVPLAVVPVISATLLTGCKDENQPDYWIEKAEDPKWRPRAVKRLDQFYQDSLTRAGGKSDDPEVKKFVDKISPTLTKVYVESYADLDAKTRSSLMKLIAGFRDPRTEPALKKALEEYAKKPTDKADEDDIRWVIRAQEDLKLPGLNPALVEVFQKVRASTMLGGNVYKDLNATMIAVADKSWAGPLKKMLEGEIVHPSQTPDDKEAAPRYRDQLFWQTVAAQVLGELGDASAVEPLLKVILDPTKADIASTAVLALVKIGKPTVDAAVKLLKGEDKALADYHLAKVMKAGKLDKAPDDQPYVAWAAVVLGSTGRQEAIAPLIEVLKAPGTKEQNKAVILRELAKIPPTPASKAAFQEGVAGLTMDARLPPSGEKALPALVGEAAPAFYDPGMIPWLIEQGEKAKGDADDVKDFRSQTLLAVLKLAQPGDMARAEELLGKWGTKQDGKIFEKPMFDLTKAIVSECGDRAACYLDAAAKSDAQRQDTQFKGIKGAYMLGILGDEKTADAIVDKLSSFENAAVRFVIGQSIDRLLPKGSDAIVKKLDAIIKKNAETGDRDRISGDAGLKQVMYRLRARSSG